MNILRTKQGRSISGRSSLTVASCLSSSARLGLSHKGMLRQADAIKVLTGPKEDDGMSELDMEFLRSHIRRKGLSKLSVFKTRA